VVSEYPSWRNYFDLVITGAMKPAFFTEGRPFLEIDGTTRENTVLGRRRSLERWKVYQGGNLPALERMTGIGGEKVLYVGDHIYGDILRSRKASLWRTCMVVQELEDEIRYTEGRAEEIARLGEVELLLARLDDELNVRKGHASTRSTAGWTGRRRERRAGGPGGGAATGEDGAGEAPARAADSTGIADVLERDVELGFNPFWGLMFKEGNENSRFGSQVEQYACLLHVAGVELPVSLADAVSPGAEGPDAHEQAGAPDGADGPLGARVHRRARTADSQAPPSAASLRNASG
jgi:hypothetical protein